MDETAQIKKLEEKLQPLPQYKGRYPKPVVTERKEVKRKVGKLRELKRMKDGRIKEVRALDLFLDEWLRNGGNATEAAMKVLHCKSRVVAATTGAKYLNKARVGGRLMLERKGWTYEQLLMLAIENMKRSDNPNWWDRIMKIAGHENFIGKEAKTNETNVVNIIQTEKSLLDRYISGEDEEELIEVQEIEDPEKVKK